MNRTLVLTMGDAEYKPLTDLTFPKARSYAECIGADFRVISDRVIPNVHMGYEKFQARRLLDEYSRIAYLDGDVLVRSGTPSVFDMVPFGYFSAMNEFDHFTHWTKEMLATQLAPYGWDGPWNWGQFNSGVMVFDETHKRLFENPVVTNIPLWDQPYLNVAVRRMAIPMFKLPPEYNFMVFHRYANHAALRLRSHMLHFSGVPLSQRIQALREELNLPVSPT